MLSPCDLNDCLISQSKLPERDDVAIACFDVIFDNRENCTKVVHKIKEKCTIIVQINDFLLKTHEKCTFLCISHQ